MNNLTNRVPEYLKQKLLSNENLVAKFGPDLHIWDEDVLREHLCGTLEIPWVEATMDMVSVALFQQDPEGYTKFRALPTYQGDISLHLLIADPFDAAVIRALRNRFQREIHLIGASQLSIDRTTSWVQREAPMEQSYVVDDVTVRPEITSWNYKNGDSPRALVERIVEEAYVRRASDIFFEPFGERLRIRFKISGVCQTMPPLSGQFRGEIINAAKTFTGLTAGETRGYRDGEGDQIMSDGRQIRIRSVAQRTKNGERVTYRLLPKGVIMSLGTDLPFGPEGNRIVHSLINKKQGLIVICGPTGSGKTTTLWRMLSNLDSAAKNILTVEQPIEFEQEGINQLPVSRDDGTSATPPPETFAKATHSLLRSAPDVVLIGETRDPETAKVAIEATLTGHLIFTTTHTPRASGVISRFRGLGVSAQDLRETLLAIISQRLVRKLCPACRVATPTDKTHQRHFSHHGLPTPEYVYSEGGCPQCGGAGYRGATPVFELMEISEVLRKEINEEYSEHAMNEVWRKHGGRSLAVHALSLAAEGLISYELAHSLDPDFTA